MMTIRIWIGLLILSLGVGCATLGDFASDNPGFEELPGTFPGRFLAVSDADMAGTAYADGKLEPLVNARDEATLFRDGQPHARQSAPNSVISWPQIVDVSPDGRRAYVVETKGEIDRAIEQVEDTYAAFPAGNQLTVYDVTGGNIKTMATVRNIGLSPQSVEVSANNRFLVIATEDAGTELTIVPLNEAGLPGELRRFPLNPPYQEGNFEKRIRTVHLSPDMSLLAVNVGNIRVQFYKLSYDETGLPMSFTAIGETVEPGVRLAIGRWTPDSRFFLITDVNSYESSLAMLTQKGGQVHVIEPPSVKNSGRLIDSVRVGRFAEGLEISDDGRFVASIAMERTYLPKLPFLEFWPRRRRYMLSLLALDPETGVLETLDRVRVAGVLPEDVIFDASGKHLAVAVFHRRKGPDRQRGFIDFFDITEDDKLKPQGRTQAVTRGVHDLVRIPGASAQ